MRDKLSVKQVEKLKKPGRHGDGGGLELQVTKTGTKSWLFRYMRQGETHWLGLGPYPDVTLAEAREAAAEQRKLLRDGVDPIGAKRAQRAALAAEAAKSMTFEECAEQFITMKQAEWKHAGKSAGQWRSSLKAYAYPVIGQQPVTAVDEALVLKLLKPIWTTKTETASRVRSRIENVLDWAKAAKLREGDNPARWTGHLEHLLPAPTKVTPVEHFAALPYRDLPTFMAKLRAKEGISARALEFTILTVARTGNIIGAKWTEIEHNDRLWTVPGPQLKGEKGKERPDHVVPLSEQSYALLEDLPREGEFIFPGGKAGYGLSNAAMDQLLKGMGYTGVMATVHGFRSTFKDWAGDMTGYPNELTEMAMAHTINDKVEAAYRRSDMREKRRRLMQDWADYCGGVAVGGENVTPMRAA